MNEYKIKVNLERGLIINPDIHLVQNDYNSTTFDFEFDDDSYEQYTKVFQLQYPDGTIWKKEIKDNKVTLANFDEEGNPVSILVQTGKYYFDIAVYDNDSKLTTTEKVYFNVREEITGEDIELDDRLPVLDDLINTVNKNLNETDNLDIDIENSIITITKKDGTIKSENVKGEKGDKGDAGSIKFIIVNELPTEDIDESAMYLKRIVIEEGQEEEEQNKYEEYIFTKKGWELVGTAKVEVDLTDYVKNTDYATTDKGGVVKINANYGVQISPTYNSLQIVPANNAAIDNRTSNFKPITPFYLDYAVGSVLPVMTQAEYDELVANGTVNEDLYYCIVEE